MAGASKRGGAVSAPPYTHTHSGPVIVCGSAECLPDDYKRAREMFRLAPVIAVNAASGFTKAIIVFSQHPRKLPRWIAWQERRFGVDFTVHSAGKAHMASNLGNETPMPWVDHWWDGVATGGTSAWGARRLARLLGFDTVILAGVPLETGPYYNGDLPSKTNQSFEAMEHYRQAILKDTDMHDGVFSLSGWTREVFGEPNVADPVA